MDKEQLSINYVKRKNTELFKQFQKDGEDVFSQLQNYLPIYNRFLALNETNYNSVNLNHTWFLTGMKHSASDNKGIYNCTIQHISNSSTKKTSAFLKFAPLLDPFKYLMGKYNTNDPMLFTLPKLHSTKELGTIHPKIIDCNNSAYVDGFFSYLSSLLIHNYNFINLIDYP